MSWWNEDSYERRQRERREEDECREDERYEKRKQEEREVEAMLEYERRRRAEKGRQMAEADYEQGRLEYDCGMQDHPKAGEGNFCHCGAVEYKNGLQRAIEKAIK